MTIAWAAAGATHVGRVRKGNEDSFRLDEPRGIFLVADGMGGHAAGEIASRLAADAAFDVLRRARHPYSEEAILAAFEAAQRRIVECCAGDPQTAGMGTTLTVGVLDPEGTLHAGHVGDSRIYLQSGELLRQISHDHTWVQREVDGGRLKIEESKLHPLSHILTRVLTSEEPESPDVFTTSVKPGDILLLCTDGLHNLVDGPGLLDALLRHSDPAEAVDRLIRGANKAGGHDNVTAIVVRILADGGG